MSAAGKIALGVASGYLLGRRKKFKLAITVGSMLAGQRIATNPRALLKQGQQLIESNEELSKLSDQVRGQLFEAARSAAVATANSRMNSLSDAIRDRSERFALGSGDDVVEGEYEESDEDDESDDDYDDYDDEYDDDDEDDEDDVDESDETGEEEPEESEEPDESEESEEPDEPDEEEDEEEEEPPRRRPAKKAVKKAAKKAPAKKAAAKKAAPKAKAAAKAAPKKK